jgi:hypothetical protein
MQPVSGRCRSEQQRASFLLGKDPCARCHRKLRSTGCPQTHFAIADRQRHTKPGVVSRYGSKSWARAAGRCGSGNKRRSASCRNRIVTQTRACSHHCSHNAPPALHHRREEIRTPRWRASSIQLSRRISPLLGFGSTYPVHSWLKHRDTGIPCLRIPASWRRCRDKMRRQAILPHPQHAALLPS